ncbi:hypothetical protein [Corynebacterium mastitidis]|uniref:hypothetical protein n=1 Tax=Corynebacterium mastitidis TaxID=161890 RepID=UPI00254F7C43|nr:hypothetical protein [Corynebacterium mastitidis]MDK8449425.1 hypothetical protein [Corynebacterium mastitidis]
MPRRDAGNHSRHIVASPRCPGPAAPADATRPPLTATQPQRPRKHKKLVGTSVPTSA